MKSKEKRIDKLKQVLALLSRGEIVQNRQLKTVLGAENYARYCDDYREQTQLRKLLRDKPDEIIEYEKRLRDATFAYNKADSKSIKRQHKSASKMFNYTDGLFERLAEYLRLCRKVFQRLSESIRWTQLSGKGCELPERRHTLFTELPLADHVCGFDPS